MLVICWILLPAPRQKTNGLASDLEKSCSSSLGYYLIMLLRHMHNITEEWMFCLWNKSDWTVVSLDFQPNSQQEQLGMLSDHRVSKWRPSFRCLWKQQMSKTKAIGKSGANAFSPEVSSNVQTLVYKATLKSFIKQPMGKNYRIVLMVFVLFLKQWILK